MTGAYILATEYSLPDRVITNDDLEAMHPAWRMRDVEKRTGVLERHWASPTETSLDLGVAACELLFSRIDFNRQDIDTVLFCTQSPDYVMPSNACLLQESLGLSSRVSALDFSLACSGYVYGLLLAKGMIAAGTARHVLLVTAETYSKLFNANDRGPATLFGDGAAATIVSAGRDGMTGFVMGTDGRGARCFHVPAGGARTPKPGNGEAVTDRFGNSRSPFDIHMDGASVLAFVKREIPPLAKDVLERAGLTMNEIDLVMVHQASRLGIDQVHQLLDVPEAKQFTNVARVGNTVSASIPILLRDAELENRLRPGMRLLTLAFGVGWSWGGCVITW